MARIKRRRGRPPIDAEVKARAFDLFASLDADLKHEYTLVDIGNKLGISSQVVWQWCKDGEWKKKLSDALEKAQARASTRPEIEALLTRYLYDDKTVVAFGNCKSQLLKKYNARKNLRLSRVIKHLGDVIYEMRIYNHKLFRALVAKKGDNIPEFAVPVKNRIDLHMEWKNSLDKIFELFSIGTIKELAADVVSNDFLKNSVQTAQPDTPNSVTFITNNTLNTTSVTEKAANLIASEGDQELDDSGQMTVMNAMLMQTMTGGISGPTGYTGPKEHNEFARTEDAEFTKQRRPDSESEE